MGKSKVMFKTCDDFANQYNTFQGNKYLLDVRNGEEVSEGILPGAFHIPLPLLAERVENIPKNKTIFIYCRSGKRAKTAADILIEHGLTDVIVASDGGYEQLKILMEVKNETAF